MRDRFARHLPGPYTAMVPGWAKAVYPHARPAVIGPPRGHDPTGNIRPVEMLIDDSGRSRTFLGYIRIPKDAAEAMAAGDGGWVEVGFATPVLFPWSHLEFVAIPDDAICRVCGCTNDAACPGGCAWAEPDLCTSCVDREPTADG